MRPTNNMEYYDFFNLNNYIDKCKIKGFGMSFRYLKDYINTKISMFKYENLPDGLTSRILETILCFNNFVCFYKNTLYPNGIVCRFLPVGEFDEYWRPTKIDLITLTGKPVANNVDYKDVVVLHDNSMDIIPFITISEYINKINLIETTLAKNIKQARIPTFLTGSKEQVKQFMKIIADAESNDPFAIADPKTADAMKQYDIKFAIPVKDTLEVMKNYMNWTVQSFGVYAGSTQKAERMLVSEVQSQTDYSDMIYQDEKDCREEFIKEINEKFGLNIKLVESYREYTMESIKLSQSYAVATIQNQGKFNPDKKEEKPNDTNI